MEAAYLLRTSRSASMVQAQGEEVKSRRSKRGRGSSVSSSEGSQRSGSIVGKNGEGKPKIVARHLVIQRKKVGEKPQKKEEPKVKMQYAINREEEEELNKSDHESSEEEDEIKSSNSSDDAKCYEIPEDDDLSTVGIMEEV